MMGMGVAKAGATVAIGNDGAISRAFSTRNPRTRPDPEPSGGLASRSFPLSGLPADLSVETSGGPRAASELSAGVTVRTLAGGWRTIRAVVVVRHDLARGDATPMLLRGSALGNSPGRDLTLPAAQRIVLDSPRAEPVAGVRRVAVPVAHLGHLADVRPLAPASALFVHVLLDGVDAVQADGLWFEVFRPCPAALAALGPAACRAMLAAAPRLVHRSGQAQYVAPWRDLSAREAEEVI